MCLLFTNKVTIYKKKSYVVKKLMVLYTKKVMLLKVIKFFNNRKRLNQCQCRETDHLPRLQYLNLYLHPLQN